MYIDFDPNKTKRMPEGPINPPQQPQATIEFLPAGDEADDPIPEFPGYGEPLQPPIAAFPEPLGPRQTQPILQPQPPQGWTPPVPSGQFAYPTVPVPVSLPVPQAPVHAVQVYDSGQLAQPQRPQLPVPSTSFRPSYIPDSVHGDLEQADFGRPWLNIVQPGSDLCEVFPRGSLVYQKTHDLGSSFLVVIAALEKVFKSDTRHLDGFAERREAEVIYPDHASALQAVKDGRERKLAHHWNVSFLMVLPKNHPAAAACENYLGDYAFVPAMFQTKASSNKAVAATLKDCEPGGFLNRGGQIADYLSGIYTISSVKNPGIKGESPYWSIALKPAQNIDPALVRPFV